MGYRDPAIHQRQVRFLADVNAQKAERVALAMYGLPYYDLPVVLRQAVDREAYSRPKLRTGRRFDNIADRTRAWVGWRTDRTYREQIIEEERLAAVEVRKRRSKRKVRARRFSGRRPEMSTSEEAA